VRDGDVRSYEITPVDIGVRSHPIDDLAGGDASMNATIAREVLGGGGGARHDIVIANAGAALYVSGAAPSTRAGVALADESIRSGAAMRKLEQLIAETNA
jgi:anthranilate phosphoribosyltransferase